MTPMSRRTLLTGTAAAATVGAASWAAGNYWVGARPRPSRAAGKKVIIITTTHERPALLSSKQMPSFYDAGAATAEKFFESTLKAMP